MIRALTIATLALLTGTAHAAATETMPVDFAMQKSVVASVPTALPTPLPAPAPLSTSMTPSDRDAYRTAFAAIRAGDWTTASATLDALPNGLLTPVARAELFTAKGSPKADVGALAALVARAPELPEMPQLARMAAGRGATGLASLPAVHDLQRVAGAPKRRTAQSVKSDAAAATLSAQATPLIKADQPAAAEALLNAAADLSTDARTEWQQRIAWAFFLAGDDVNARRLAAAAESGMGEWAVQADWVQGLAAFRQHDCTAAAAAFGQVAARARDTEMTAAGLFWSARADTACGHPERVEARLRSAARLTETFYGLLAAGQLGVAAPSPEPVLDLAGADGGIVSGRPNLRVAAALVEVGERRLADEVLRWQARIGDPAEHQALLHLAAHLQLPSAQIWLAQNAPAGAHLAASARYPAPNWAPQGGWRVDRALLFAHALQESQFRTDAVSPAGARGLMQVRLGTAQDIARKRGASVDAAGLNDPATNFEYGQSYLEQLRDAAGTEGLLPKVIAAYNAGPGAVAKWIGRDRGDPLMFIESIPYYETRAYVAIVLRNYWMYQRQQGRASASMTAMAQGLWPRFPGIGGETAVRLTGFAGPVASAR